MHKYSAASREEKQMRFSARYLNSVSPWDQNLPLLTTAAKKFNIAQPHASLWIDALLPFYAT